MNIKLTNLFSLVLFLALTFSGINTFAQDKVPKGAEPIVDSIIPENLKYDILVDGNLKQDDPENKKFKSLKSAYEFAKEGTEDNPTVIGIKPNVYKISGGLKTPSLTITKNYITFLGLTNNRRSVVIADNRGLQQGSDDNGYILDVNAVGFTVKNLTIVNYCNLDYEYPGDPSKNLYKRSDVITQGVALKAAGDKHTYENVAILGRLDTMFLLALRAYFKNVFVEGTDDWIGGRGIAFWEDCTLSYPTGSGVMLSMNNVFKDCRFKASERFQFYKVTFGSHKRPSVLIDCIIPISTDENRVAWMREEAPARPEVYSLTWNLKDANGNKGKIYDCNVGEPSFKHSRELSAEELKAFNPWNLLRAVPGKMPDNWDPAGVRKIYEKENQGDLVYRLNISGDKSKLIKSDNFETSYQIRTGEEGVKIKASVIPIYANDTTITWKTDSDLIKIEKLAPTEAIIKGNNFSEHSEWIPIKVSANNGFYNTVWIYVEPSFIDPPKLISAPKLSSPSNGKVKLDYSLNLEGREDHSLITWSVCRDQNCENEKVIAVSRDNDPLKTLELNYGYVGKYLKVTLQPKHQRSEAGKKVSVISENPILKSDINTNIVSPNFKYFDITPDTSFSKGMWSLTKNWKIESATGLENNYGIHSTDSAFIYYVGYKNEINMQIDFIFRPDKSAGQVFNVPGSPSDIGPNNLHADLYIKYDPITKNGYSLRFWRTTQASDKCMFQFYKIVNGVGSPLDNQKVLSGVFKRDTYLTLNVIGNKISVKAKNNIDSETLDMSSTLIPNNFSGTGMFWSRGASAICSKFEITYPQ